MMPLRQLISRRRAPKLKPKAALVGITCPFWYARAGVVMAVETANLTENEAKENRRLARQGTSELLRSQYPDAESRNFKGGGQTHGQLGEGIKYIN